MLKLQEYAAKDVAGAGHADKLAVIEDLAGYGKCWSGMREGWVSPSARSAAAVPLHSGFFW